MKRYVILTVSLLLAMIFFILPSATVDFTSVDSAAESKSLGWYCMHKAGNLQPECESSMKFIENYGGYYIDKKHGDDNPEKVVYLTFDAGYENGNVAKTLDILKAENVSGAFFILGHLLDAEAPLVERMINEGHTVCNHTLKHKDMTGIHSLGAFSAELEALEKLYTEKTGKTMPKYYRPPEGKFSEENMKFANELGYKTIFWSFAYADWDNNHQMAPAAAEKKILANIHNGAVLLLHPTSATNAAVLGNVIKNLKSQGYSFGTLDRLTAQQTIAEKKRIALTFDDGPHPKSTPKVLDILGEYGIKATFFEIGENVKYYPAVSERVIREGHEVGNHTNSHPHLTDIDRYGLNSEIEKCEKEIYERFGYKTKLFRPPEGIVDDDVRTLSEEMNYKVVLWTVDTRDWTGKSAEEISATVLSNVKNGSIILLHDYTTKDSHTVEALSQFIPKLIDQGYEFVTVGELLG